MWPTPLEQMGHPCDATSWSPRGGNRRSFHGHWVGLFFAPIHPRVCGEQDRDQYSRTAEDGPSPRGGRGGLCRLQPLILKILTIELDLFQGEDHNDRLANRHFA